MSIAHEIAAAHPVAADAYHAAEVRAIAKDQIWEGRGYTIYVFDDNSLLAQSEMDQIAVDGDDRESVLSYMRWLGTDAPLDKQRLDDMLDAVAE